jgi:hypothetical protein
MLVILVTQEAEIRKITIQGLPRQNGSKTLSQKYPTTTKKAGRVAQMVECLPSNQTLVPHKKFYFTP